VNEQINALKKRGVTITVDNKKKRQDIPDEEYDNFLIEKRKSKGERLPPQQHRTKDPLEVRRLIMNLKG